MDQPAQEKWAWSVSAPVKEATADQIWPLLKDFFNLHKSFPGLPTCYEVHGNNGEVGCIRYCTGFSIPSVDGTKSWSKESLTAIDPMERMIRYEIVDCNIGWKDYISTVKICPGSGDGGCVMTWFVTVDPIEGRRMEEMVNKYEAVLKAMAKKMENDSLGRSGNYV